MDRRLGRGGFFLAWAVLFGLQVACFAQMPSGENEVSSLTMGLGVAMLVLQLLKLPITTWRLNDVGHSPSDALLFVLLPVANIIGLMRFMPMATPSPGARAKAMRAWADQLGPVTAVARAIPLVLRSWPVMIPTVIVYGVVMATVAYWTLGVMDWANLPENIATRDILAQVFTAVAGLLGLYTLVQVGKRKAATRVSWIPSLFLLPAVLLAAAFTFFGSATSSQLQPVLIMLLYQAWGMVFMSFAGATLVIAATLAAEQIRTGEGLDAGLVFKESVRRTPDVSAPHGTRVQAVTVGIQVLIPGIFYMLQLAFADTVAILKPDAGALSQSSKLTWGMRGRLFRLFLLLNVAFTLLYGMGVTLIDSPEAAMAYVMDPRALSFPAFVIGEILWALYFWLVQVALLLMYHDRIRYISARRAAQKARTEAPVAEPSDDSLPSVAEPTPA